MVPEILVAFSHPSGSGVSSRRARGRLAEILGRVDVTGTVDSGDGREVLRPQGGRGRCGAPTPPPAAMLGTVDVREG
eukprot:5910694-Pyramimonas_sp.AAC.1